MRMTRKDEDTINIKKIEVNVPGLGGLERIS